MIGFHVQNGVPNWLDAVAKLPPGTWLKVFSEQHGQEIKNRGDYKVVRRHWYDPNQIFGGSFEENKARARIFFNSFVNNTFRQYAQYIDAIEGFNEYVANSQNQQEIDDRIRWVQASQQVWASEYRNQSELAHIRLCSVNAAIGNDIHWQMARAVADNDGLLGYHAYIPVNRLLSSRSDGILPNEWKFYSGRWSEMDKTFISRGISVKWLMTEGGEVKYFQCGNGTCLDPIGGWKENEVCAGNIDRLLPVLKYWLDKTKIWNSENNNRCLGVVLFTSGGGSQWQSFEKRQPELNHIADFVRNHTVTLPPPTILPQPIITKPNGTDISHWQGNIDWQRMKSQNIKFVFIKASEANEFRDPRFDINWQNAKTTGLFRGAYHFYRNNANPITQAHLLVSQMNGDLGELPPVLDCEDTQGTVVRANIQACLQEIESLTGKRPIIYTGAWWWNPKVGNVDWAREYDLWVAQYANVQQPTLPVGWDTWKFWQYSNNGSGLVYGAESARIDLNFFNGTDADLETYVNQQIQHWNKHIYLFSPRMGGLDKITKIINTEIIPNRHDLTWSADSAFAPQTNVFKTKVIVYNPGQWGGSIEALEQWVIDTYGELPDIEYRWSRDIII